MSDPENFLVRWSRLKRAAALEENGEPPTPAFDPTSLPAIDSIDAATDIRPFLEVGVPEELRRAALRSTWSADPSIRDFVGIAENQWDFNDPATIPGFGVRAAAEYAGSLAAHGIGSLNTAVGTPAEKPPMGELPASDGTCGDPADVAREVTAAVTERSDDADVGAPEEPTSKTALFTHGGALPR